jgi:two-component system catabolic regulation response regulator CreB/two-component system response regulator ChvI
MIKEPKLNEQQKKKRILAVDNDPDNTLVVRIALEDNGFEVDAFNDPTEAISAFKPNLYDLLILNIKMPTMDGFKLYQKLRKIDAKAKVCFLSGFGEQYAHETGFDLLTSSSSPDISFMRKPVPLDELVKK